VFALPGNDHLALVQTVDFFTPIVDDPFDWGRIAAANAFSDVYAMGGRPVTALNLVAWPVEQLPLEMLARVLEGGAAIAAEAEVTILGGHSIHDPEPKYGMAVTGFVDPARMVRNSTMRAGDLLYLTKSLGLGIIATAVKAGKATPHQLRAAVESMATLNAAASEAMLEAGATACTDVTGFGLMGHLHVALRAAGLSAVLDASAVPFLEGAADLARAGMVPSGTRSNLEFVKPFTDWGQLGEIEQLLLADAQTSGGLLIAIPPGEARLLEQALGRRGLLVANVGRVVDGGTGRIVVAGTVAG
jgi:selenide, water dikinase